MKTAKVLKRSISIHYRCDNGSEHAVKIDSPTICTYSVFEDLEVDVIKFDCKYCGEQHSFELN